MVSSDSTCWTLIRGAAEGRSRDRDDFARCYAPVIRAYLGARWKGTRYLGDLDDAAQEVFVDCFRDCGALERYERERPGGFRAFLYGVTRVVALRFERSFGRQRAPIDAAVDPATLEDDAPGLSKVFDRAWASALLREAARLQTARATELGAEALRRVELLRLRFQEGLPIRAIAQSWSLDPERLHKDYARARREFREALVTVITLHHPGPVREVERRCAALIDLLD